MALPCQNPDPDPVNPAPNELQLRVDFFRKLGYSLKDVEAAFQKLDLDTDTNTILGELVRIGAQAAPGISDSDNDKRSTGFKKSLMPPSWTLPSRGMREVVHKKNTDEELRPIVIDGSNVAMSHGNKTIFSCRGIQLAVNFFLDRGHNYIKVFVPSWRKEQPRADTPIRDQHILTDLENCGIIVFTPSRHLGGKRVVCYDDRFIVKVASESEGVIVSNDTYRDLQGENSKWKKCIEERLLMYSFVNDKFMPPDDPLGRHGPTLDNFLRKKPLPTEQKRDPCPYNKKCTYGIKCKYYHPERTDQSYISVADKLREKAQISSNEHSARSSPKSSLQETDTLKTFQVSENMLSNRDVCGSSQNHLQASGEQSENERPVHHYLMPSHYYGSGSQDCLDSGLGSYESLTNSQRLWAQQPSQASPGSRHTSVHLEKNNMSQSSHSGPFTLSLSTGHQPMGNIEEQPKYSPFAFPHTIPNKSSLPISLQYNSAPLLEQSCWSNPYQGMPQARTSLPAAFHPNNLYNSSQYNSWEPPAAFGANDPIRMDLRHRLQAIFNPKDIDIAMEMFPNLTDIEKLAAEILKLKAQRGIFQ